MSLINQMEMLANRESEIAKLRAIVSSGARVLTEAGLPTAVKFGEMGSAPTRTRRPAKSPKSRAQSGSRRPGPKLVRKARRKSDGGYEFYDVYESEDLDDGSIGTLRDSDGDDDLDDHFVPGEVDPNMLDAAQAYGIR